jgi:phospholipid transport system substrate-binding protein
VVQVLQDPVLAGDDRAAERRRAVRTIADEIFDWREIARRALARHWQALSEPQRAEFVALFTTLLEHSYISKLEQYGGERIVYLGERVDGGIAPVNTRIVTTHGTEVPIGYRLVKQGDAWRVYDVSIEGVSLVSNYRTQFNAIIQTASYDALIDKLRSRQGEVAAGGASAGKAEPVRK